jgi:hypothetical protein
MLNAKALSELLTKNSDARLCKRWFLMTPNGTLLAYTKPTDIKDLRRQAARTALLWQEQLDAQRAGTEPETNKVQMPALLQTLTIEMETGNTIVRKVQPQLLLVLEGGVPPRRPTFEPRTTPEGPGDGPYPATNTTQHNAPNLASSVSSAAESTKSVVSQSVLGLQRKKLDALAAAIAQNFEQTGFRMPDQGKSAKIF